MPWVLLVLGKQPLGLIGTKKIVPHYNSFLISSWFLICPAIYMAGFYKKAPMLLSGTLTSLKDKGAYTPSTEAMPLSGVYAPIFLSENAKISITMNKHYNQAPLPFMGQKRKFLKQFKESLKDYPKDATYVDLFGGSGLLSRTVKDFYPSAKVVYNDFDNYKGRIDAIPSTNVLLADIRSIVGGFEKDKRMPEAMKAKILRRIKKEVGFVDYITLSSSLLFSMKYVRSFESLTKETFYNVVKETDYNADGYLKGLKVVRKDYKLLFNEYKERKYVVLLVDPPYLSTEAGTYNGYWKLGDYLDVLNLLNSHNYFYFTSNKSHIIELCKWLSSNSDYKNPFENAGVNTTQQTMNYSSSYTDIMLFSGYTSTY
jgi:hypothetical protein